MLPERRTFISPHQLNTSRPAMPHERSVNQHAAPHIPERPLNVQPRTLANPFHRFHHEAVKQHIYDRLHPRNMYHATLPGPQPERQDTGVEVSWSQSHDNK